MKSSFSRSFFSASIILLISMMVLGASFQTLFHQYVEDKALEDLERDGSSIASLAAAYYRDGNFSSPEFRVNLSVVSQISGADTIICDAAGRLVICSDSPLGCEHQGMVIDQTYLNQIYSTGAVTSTGVIQGFYEDDRYIAALPIIGTGSSIPIGVVIMSKPTAQTLSILGRISDIYLFVALLVVAISAIFIIFLARRQARPLREMASAASAFGHGKLDARVKVERSCSDEMQELALAFNNMASSLQKSEYQRQEFVANVSHELKTPMTTIGGYLDGMLDGTIPPEKHRYYMTMVSDETKRLSRLVRSMLDISRLQDQGGIPEEKKSRFDICECAGQVLITFEQKINSKHLEVNVDFPDLPVFTMADQDAITQVIYNLVDNAVKFCPDGKELGLQVRQSDAKIYITISNEGQTIPAEELPLVFDRFHKLDKSRSQNRDGWGLGLYIVKTIVCSHGEDISVASRDGKTAFTFTLPLVT